MLSSEQKEKYRIVGNELAELKERFKAILNTPFSSLRKKNDPALADLLDTLDKWYDLALLEASNENDSTVKIVGSLHEAKSYDKIRMYIRDQIS